MGRIGFTKVDLEIDDLLLDLENPRIGTANSQSEALEAIIRLNLQHFRNMMSSIKVNNLDPGDSFYVISAEEEEGSFIVVDGNRRLSALKVLCNPDLLDGTKIGDGSKRRLRDIAAGFVPLDSVSCVLFDNRPDANEWIERRHGKNLVGEGRISWGPLESDRFQKDRTVLDVIGFVERNSTFPEADWHRIKKSVEKSPTTLRRFLVSKPGKHYLGFVEKKGEDGPAFKRDPGLVIDILSQLFSDIDAGEVTSRTHNVSTEIAEYFESLPNQIAVENQPETVSHAFASTIISDGVKRPRVSTKATSSPSVKTKKVTPPRATLAPSKHPFVEPTNEKGKQLLREASKLNLRDTPLGSAFLFRALLEFSVETEMRKSGLSERNSEGQIMDLKARFSAVCQHLIVTPGRLIKAGDLHAIKAILTAQRGTMSFAALNGYVHNHFQKPSPDDLRNAWDSAIPLFTAIYGAHR